MSIFIFSDGGARRVLQGVEKEVRGGS